MLYVREVVVCCALEGCTHLLDISGLRGPCHLRGIQGYALQRCRVHTMCVSALDHLELE